MQDDRIDLILDWAENHPKFDTTFVESLRDSNRDAPTEAQSNALDNIIERFGIE
jgi:hypothetical protein